jgi:hypothetical protein
MGKYLDKIQLAEKTHEQTGQDQEPVQRQRCPVEALSLVPGSKITWQGADGREQTGVVDFLQTYPGEVWAFCTLPDGRWCAVNAKHCTKSEPA